MLEYHKCNTKFRFGDGPVVTSVEKVLLPITLGSRKFNLDTCIVESDVPLLISRPSLERADATISFGTKEIWIGFEQIPVVEFKSGHMGVPLISRNIKQTVKQVLFSCPLQQNDDKANEKKILKLHKQFAHPKPEKLIDLIRKSGVCDKKISDIVQSVSKNCDTCQRFQRSPLRPVVAMPLASEFNEVVAMDLKFIDRVPILHLIDHVTRYSMSCSLKNKRAITVVESILNIWVRVFGAPSRYFLSDNGGEFVNDELRELCSKFNIGFETTAAESCWSNGLVERHHVMIEDNVRKVRHDTDCSLELAIPWANCAKNSLANVYGFSANQLVFGRNLNYPSVHHDRFSAHNESSKCSVVVKHLVALHKTRQAFIAQESSEKLRRALNRQTRTFSDVVFKIGDIVYYYKNDQKEPHGPAKIIGVEKSQCLLKHGGGYTRVHPCRMRLKDEVDTYCMPSKMLLTPNDESKSSNVVNQKSVVSNNEDRESVCESNDEEDDNNMTQNNQHMLTPPATPAHNPPVVLHDDLDNNQVPIIDIEQNNSFHDNDPNVPQSPPNSDQAAASPIESPKSTDTQKPTRQSRILARLYDHNKPGPKDSTNVPIPSDKPPDPLNKDKTHDDKSRVDHSSEEDSAEEVYFSTNSARYDKAKQEELAKWIEFNAYEEVPDIGQTRVTTRWVCTEKVKGGVMQIKARLVARGFEEDKSQIRTDSPTCYKDSLRLLLTLLSAKKWSMKSMDVRRAYLQGNKIQRKVYLKPPKEAKTDKLWLLIQTPDGIVDAGRQWYIRVHKEFTALQAKNVKCDRAVFVWEDPVSPNSCCGVIVAHVDDFLYGGNEYFLTQIIPKIREKLKIGLEEESRLKYLGLNISQDAKGIELSLENYIEGTKEMETSELGPDKTRLLIESEKSQLKQLVGQINWAATQCRPDISYENCVLGGLADKGKVEDVFQANKVIRKIKSQKLNLFFSSQLDLKSIRLVTFCDAAFANLPDYGSQGGQMTFIVDKNGVNNLIAWKSKRIKRVVNSSLSAECLIGVEAAETAILIRDKLEQMLCYPPQTIPISVISDSKSLVESVHKTTSVENKAMQIDINMIREMLENNIVSEFRWIATKSQIANALTKRGASTDEIKRILTNSCKFNHNTSIFD